MRRIGWVGAILLGLLFHNNAARGESPLDVLQEDLTAVKQQHQEASSQMFTSFVGQLDKAMASPDEAISLYQAAGGELPDDAPIISRYGTTLADESPAERDERNSVNQANANYLASVVQLHCGLMRYAALFVESPDQKGLHDAWIAWLKASAQVYPQLSSAPPDTRTKPDVEDDNSDNERDRNRDRHKDGPKPPPKKKQAPPPDKAAQLKDMAVRDSMISTYLGFNAWDDKEQGQWKVRDLPNLYRAQILDPSRKTPSAATLAAWDVFIAMKNADELDREKWNQIEYPALQFERGCDDFAITPSTDKLVVLVNLIKAYPTYPVLDDWIERAQKMTQDFRAQKEGGVPATNSTTPTPTPAKS